MTPAETLCVGKSRRPETTFSRAAASLYPSLCPPAHPIPTQTLLRGEGGPPGPSRPSPGTPGRPTRPEPPGYRPGVPCRPRLATAGSGTGCVAVALLAKAQPCPGRATGLPTRLSTTRLRFPFLLPPSPCRFYSVPTSQPSKQRAKTSISLLRVFPLPFSLGRKAAGTCKRLPGRPAGGTAEQGRDGGVGVVQGPETEDTARLRQPGNCTPGFQKHLPLSPGRWA